MNRKEYEKIASQYREILQRKIEDLNKLYHELKREIRPVVPLPRKTFWIVPGEIFWESVGGFHQFEDGSPVDCWTHFDPLVAIYERCGYRPACIIAASRALDEAIRWCEEQIAFREKEAQRILNAEIESIREMEAEIAMQKLAEE